MSTLETVLSDIAALQASAPPADPAGAIIFHLDHLVAAFNTASAGNNGPPDAFSQGVSDLLQATTEKLAPVRQGQAVPALTVAPDPVVVAAVLAALP